MTVKIIVDSACDIPQRQGEELGIKILPLSENAGMSSENYVGIIMAENLRFLGEGSSAQGKPKAAHP